MAVRSALARRNKGPLICRYAACMASRGNSILFGFPDSAAQFKLRRMMGKEVTRSFGSYRAPSLVMDVG